MRGVRAVAVQLSLVLRATGQTQLLFNAEGADGVRRSFHLMAIRPTTAQYSAAS